MHQFIQSKHQFTTPKSNFTMTKTKYSKLFLAILTTSSIFIIMQFHLKPNIGQTFDSRTNNGYFTKRSLNVFMNNQSGTKCSEINHTYFLKIHKAGSTTLQNIFLRHAMKNNLNVLTIFHESKIYSFPNKDFAGLLPRSPPGLLNGKYDVFCEHSVYDEKILMEKLHADTVNIAIVREPFSRAQSAFNYFHLAKTMNISGTDPFATFIDNLKF